MDDPTPLPDDTLVGDERGQLLAFVHDARTEIAALLDGLTEEQARRRLVPSQTTVLGVVKHCTFVEQVWFHVGLAGRSRVELDLPEAAEDSWLLTEDDTVASVRERYLRVCAEADQLTSAASLDDLVLHNRRSPLTLRWVFLHLVRELSRHAGHGDILREVLTDPAARPDSPSPGPG